MCGEVVVTKVRVERPIVSTTMRTRLRSGRGIAEPARFAFASVLFVQPDAANLMILHPDGRTSFGVWRK